MKNLECVKRCTKKMSVSLQGPGKLKRGRRSNEKSIDGVASLPDGQTQYGSVIDVILEVCSAVVFFH